MNKLNAEELASNMFVGWAKEIAIRTIEEVAQPLADERNELRKLIEDMMSTPISEVPYQWLSDNGFIHRVNTIRSKYPQKVDKGSDKG